MTPQALADLHQAAFADQRPWSADEFTTLLAAPNVFLVSHEQGFALGRLAADEVELLTLAVKPRAQRQGVGRALLASFEARARTDGAARAFLEVASDNRAAWALYDASGYRESGWRVGYYRRKSGPDCDAVTMSKPLT